MNTLTKEDLKWCLTRLPKCVIDLMKERKEQIFVAGGFIRSCITNEKVNDVDIFAPSKDLAELYAQKLKGNFRLITTDNAFTIVGGQFTLQVIHKWTFEKPEDCINSFDFVIARTIIWYGSNEINNGSWHSLCDDRYYSDLSAKRLTYCSPKRIEEVGGSMLRILKFYQRGYRISLQSLGAVIARVMTGIGNLADNDEEANAKIISGLLYEVDPDIDPNHIGHL